MSKKILHIFGAMNRGGAELRTIKLMEQLQKQYPHQYEVHYCALSGEQGSQDQRILQSGGAVHYCPIGKEFFRRFYALLKQENYDVVHSHVALFSGLTLMIARWYGVTTRIAHFRNTTDGVAERPMRRIRNALMRRLIDWSATQILGVCESALDGFWYKNWHNDSRCKAVYNGFEIPDIDYQDDYWHKILPNYHNDEKVIINVARMDFQKNHARQFSIFSALSKLESKAHLVFVGRIDAVKKSEIEQLAAQQSINGKVHFLGERADVLALLAHAHVMLFPSKWEGLPGAVIEAVAVGLPVLATSLPGIIEIQRYFDLVTSLDLNQSDQHWAVQLHDLLSHSLDYPQRPKAAFTSSPFLLAENVRQIHELYSH